MQEVALPPLCVTNFLTKYGLIPDYVVELQHDTHEFYKAIWDRKLQEIPSSITKKKFLYLFVKASGENIYSMYIGKSTTRTKNRIKQHFQGISNISLNTHQKDSASFYPRLETSFFQENQEISLWLYLIIWENPAPIENAFSFPLKVNISNAEAILTSLFTQSYPKAVLNHDFVTRLRWAQSSLRFEDIEKHSEVMLSITGKDAQTLWNNWCQKWFLLPINVPPNNPNSSSSQTLQHTLLFKTSANGMDVEVGHRSNGKPMLLKSSDMESLIITAVQHVKRSYDFYVEKQPPLNPMVYFTDGLIYMVYVLSEDLQQLEEFQTFDFPSEIVPIYIGKTEAVGRTGTYSGNLKGVAKGSNRGYFARWGYDDARHIGGLSLRFYRIPNKYPSTNYEHWLNILFDATDRGQENPVLEINGKPVFQVKGKPVLRVPVYFMMKPWYPYNISFSGTIGLFSPEIESLLVALGRELFPKVLGNKAGR
jgi:hypothetical protein